MTAIDTMVKEPESWDKEGTQSLEREVRVFKEMKCSVEFRLRIYKELTT